jgi:hypothetical protein
MNEPYLYPNSQSMEQTSYSATNIHILIIAEPRKYTLTMNQLTERGKLLTRPDESQNKDGRDAISKFLLTTSRVDS